MKTFSIAFAAATAIAFACAGAAPSHAQSSAPGATPAPRTVPKIATPPRVREIDKFATRPPGPGGTPTNPTPVDDIAGHPGGNVSKSHGGSTCYPAAGPTCVASLDKLCSEHGGGMRTNDDGSVTCVMPN